jgi:hypothetical protein
VFKDFKYSKHHPLFASRFPVTRISNIQFHNFLPPTFRNFPTKDINLLGLGSKFCPRPVEPDISIYQSAFSSVIRRFRIIDYFANVATDVEDSDFDPRFKTISTWEPPENTSICDHICRYINNFGSAVLSRSVYQRQSCISRKLKEFLQNKHVKIVAADKNIGLCIFTITDYDKMVHVHLSDQVHYLRIGLISDSDWKRVSTLVFKLHAQLLKQFRVLFPAYIPILRFISGSKRRLPIFHVLPKLHKNSSSLSSRPIVGAVQWITTRWSIYLCSILEKIVCPFSISNSLSLISKVEHLELLEDEFLVTADVSSLYTMMSLARLYDCLRAKGISDFDISIANFICSSNYFRYGSAVYKQLDGIAMGCNAAVHFANIYLDDFDNHFAPFCKFYCRYIDDIFFIWKGPEHLLNSLFSQMNAFIPDIHLTFSYSKHSVNFLDLSIFSSHNQLMFRTFQKSFNIYQYLPPFTLHSPSCISGFIKGELIRFVRSNTLLADRLIFATLFRKRLLARGYSQSYLARIFSSISFSTRRPVSRSSTDKIIPLVIPFYRNLITVNCRKLIRFLNEHFLEADSGYKFLLAFKRNPNLFQLCSRSNISKEQEEFLQERSRPRLPAHPRVQDPL